VSHEHQELSAACLQNALQLQRAARLLYRHSYFPAAFALGVTADEEIAKSILFVIANTDASLLPGLDRLLHNHRAKQALIRFVALLADMLGPAFRGVHRESRKIRSQAPDTPRDVFMDRVRQEALRIMKARGRRRRSSLDKVALLVDDIQATKNNCLYAGLSATRAVSTPQRVASKALTKAYLAALDNRVFFFTHMVLGNVENGTVELDSEARILISSSWQRFSARFKRRRKES